MEYFLAGDYQMITLVDLTVNLLTLKKKVIG